MNSILKRNLIFVSGKGGVGKTSVSLAIAQAHAAKARKTLWVTFEDPTRPMGELAELEPNLWRLNCEGESAFEEYAAMKIGGGPLTKIFLRNKVVRYLSKAAPGIHELVLLGKVWYERRNYDHIVVDMPSTGYGLAMFHSTQNFANLFKSGPLNRDAEEMLETFRDPSVTGQLIVSLPEEMPLRESLDLEAFLRKLFPDNRPGFLVNKRFPKVSTPEEEEKSPPDSWDTPFATSAADYARKRSILETHNLRLWSDAGIEAAEIATVPWRLQQSLQEVAQKIRDQLIRREILT